MKVRGARSEPDRATGGRAVCWTLVSAQEHVAFYIHCFLKVQVWLKSFSFLLVFLVQIEKGMWVVCKKLDQAATEQTSLSAGEKTSILPVLLLLMSA